MRDCTIEVPKVVPGHEESVRGMYDVLRFVLKQSNVNELTEGCHEDDLSRSYEEAQRLQQIHLLDIAGAEEGHNLFDIGCGHGVLLREAKRRGVNGVGITLSPDQLQTHQGLKTHLLNWRDILKKQPHWRGCFDVITAVGSLEHFVSPEEATMGKKTDVYDAFFDVCRQLLKRSGRLLVTAIHYKPGKVLHPKWAKNQYFSPWRWFSPQFHLGSMAWLGGAYYPTVGDLEKRAKQSGFKLLLEEDGTKDYYFTSEEWLRRWKGAILTVETVKGLVSQFRRYPKHIAYGMLAIVVFQSWNWQFREKNGEAPTVLLRYVWKRL